MTRRRDVAEIEKGRTVVRADQEIELALVGNGVVTMLVAPMEANIEPTEAAFEEVGRG